MSSVYALLFAVSLFSASGSMLRGPLQIEGETCSALKSHGSYFSVPVCVGTPAQCFDLVADTGSNHVIVPSCICSEVPGAGCAPTDKCFRGINKSSTFSISKNPKMVSITFVSGTIQAGIASDIVSVGDVKVSMEDGVLLMVNRAALKIAGTFQGILGLGIPKDKAVKASMFQVPAWPAQAGRNASGDPWRAIKCLLMPTACNDPGQRQLAAGNQEQSKPWSAMICSLMPTLCDDQSWEPHKAKLFLERARVDRFSICFHHSGQTGALRLGLSPFSSPIQNIGKLHWGLNFQGLSIGAHSTLAPTETIFCGPETMKQGMETPCGIIPDSGTTQLMGPKEQVLSLEAGICSKWERCQTHSKGVPTSQAFRHLLLKCGDWLTEEKGLLEIPSLFFHVTSGDGKPEAFELTAWAWVTEKSTHDMDGSVEKACTSDIGSTEYLSPTNGPVWIFGQPLFYEYNVGYDMSTRQMSLQKGQCEPCSTEGGPVSLSDDSVRRWPRAAHGEPRIPYYDVNLPL